MRWILWLVTLVAALVVATGVSASPADTVSASKFTVPLSGPGGSGTADLALNPGGKVCYVIVVSLTTPGDVPQEPGPGVGDAHIHAAATGGIAFDLQSTFESLGGGTFVAANCVRADKDVVREILADPEQYYINVHTTTFPGGAVSGALA
jgi:bacterioferritin-associated ferredoxin